MKKIKPVLLSVLMVAVCFFVACGDDEAIKSSDKEILSFAIDNVDGVINKETKTISVTLPYSEIFDITKLTPVIKISPKAKVTPASDTTVDFTEGQSYVVEAEDGSKQEYKVTAIMNRTSDAKIIEFALRDIEATVTIDEEKKEILVKVPYGTDVRLLTPVFSFLGKKVTPRSGETIEFSSPMNFIVEAQDETAVAYKVTVETIKTSDAKILGIVLYEKEVEAKKEIDAEITIDEAKKEITILIPATTGWARWDAEIDYIGASIDPFKGASIDEKQTDITVIAQDDTKVVYKLAVARKELVLGITSIDKTALITGEELTLTGAFGNRNVYVYFQAEGEPQVSCVTLPGSSDRTSMKVTIPSVNEGVDYTIWTTATKEDGSAYPEGVYAKKVQVKNPYLPTIDLATSPLTTTELEAGDIEIRLKGSYLKLDGKLVFTYIFHKHESDAVYNLYPVITNAEGTELWTEVAVPHAKVGKYTAYVKVGNILVSKPFTYTVKESSIKPTITHVSNITPSYDETITLMGENFGADSRIVIYKWDMQWSEWEKEPLVLTPNTQSSTAVAFVLNSCKSDKIKVTVKSNGLESNYSPDLNVK